MFATIYLPNFYLQAATRHPPELRAKPVALIDGETSLKRYVVERGRPYLKAENPHYPDLVPARELKIQGVMVSLIRKQERRKGTLK